MIKKFYIIKLEKIKIYDLMIFYYTKEIRLFLKN